MNAGGQSLLKLCPPQLTRKLIKKAIHAPKFLNEAIEYGTPFSRGIDVDFGQFKMLFVSGTASVDEKGKTRYPGNFAKQTERTFDNLTALLRAEGATWHNVVQTRCYLKNMKKYYDQFNRIRTAFYNKQKLDPFPASVGIEAELCRPELLIEIELIAIIKVKGKKRKH